MKPTTVKIETGARLHFGPLGFRQKDGPEFGGLGMTIRDPGFEIVLQTSTIDEILSPDRLKRKIEKIGTTIRQKIGGKESPFFRIEVSRDIPRHVGLGSGTQLGLALAKGMDVLSSGRERPVQELARMAGRGKRSAIGIHGFHRGGFLVDDGQHGEDEIGNLAHRIEFPENWRILLVIPKDRKGISGEREAAIFDRLEPMKCSTSEELRSLIDTAVIPSLESQNFETFSTAITKFGKIVGEYFSEYQGGIFSFPNSSKVCDVLDSNGIIGYGQTSWGPTIWIMQQSEMQASELVENMQRESVFQNSEVRIVEPLNEGAKIERQ